ncbi:MAG: VOC family protein, partial [Actinomycetota bacterium]
MSSLAGSGLRGVWHFSFTVSDLDRSIAFYRDLVGLELVHTQEQDNTYTRRLVGFPDAVLRVAQL